MRIRFRWRTTEHQHHFACHHSIAPPSAIRSCQASKHLDGHRDAFRSNLAFSGVPGKTLTGVGIPQGDLFGGASVQAINIDMCPVPSVGKESKEIDRSHGCSHEQGVCMSVCLYWQASLSYPSRSTRVAPSACEKISFYSFCLSCSFSLLVSSCRLA